MSTYSAAATSDPDRRAAVGDTTTGSDVGYDLADRFAALQSTMQRAEWHGHLETAELRSAVLPQPRRRTRRTSLRRTSRSALRTAASEA